MEPFGIVEPEGSLKPLFQLLHGPVGPDVDVLILQRPPEPFEVDVVHGSVRPVHLQNLIRGIT